MQKIQRIAKLLVLDLEKDFDELSLQNSEFEEEDPDFHDEQMNENAETIDTIARMISDLREYYSL